MEIERNKVNYFQGLYPAALKLVRGAYLSEEKEVEIKSGRELVFHEKHETDQNYNELALKVMDFLSGNGYLIIASHNNDSVYTVMEKIEYEPSETRKEMLKNRVFFATLYGLNDFLAYQCLFSKYQTIKSLSFGENDVTIPFLIRRGIECKDIMTRS